ncbi:hypothetical protein NQ314_005226 [Rhamnusium bicolor]|uniref:protein-tyrosine-phosphatase n=1 Tax=Rhamnusium bicolor TaxID=1586634 RepID=A0AAV8ZHH6_9CUCU|nr:hypothetical protein NQ314_005226 [Rhamnusium bicolor]
MDKFTNTPTEIDNYVEILNKQLYFAVIKGKGTTKLKSTMDTFFFSIDDELVYENYYCDFGPLNISCLYKYCCKLNKYLQYAKGIKSVVHYTCSYPDKKANAAYLMGSFCVLYLKIHPKDVWKILQVVGPYNFTQVGIQHFDLIFPDGTTPPKDILLKFLSIAEMAPAAIAVHCKAGLGRTGSLIGSYLIKHYRMTAKEAISWMRICRPGSVIGQQQIWLEKIESWLWRTGSQYSYSSDLYKNQSRLVTNRTDMVEHSNYLKTSSEPPNWKNVALGKDKLTQVKEKIIRNYTTQGDKLNEIKAARYNNKIISKEPKFSYISQVT